jgi:hypothetical protein
LDCASASETVLLDRLAGLFIDELLAQAVAGGFVDLAECDPLGGRGGRMERKWFLLALRYLFCTYAFENSAGQ